MLANKGKGGICMLYGNKDNTFLPFVTMCDDKGHIFEANYNNHSDDLCPILNCNGKLSCVESIAVPLIYHFNNVVGYSVKTLHIGNSFDFSPFISVEFNYEYKIQKPPSGFDTVINGVYVDYDISTKYTKIIKYIDNNMSTFDIYENWLRSLREFVHWVICMPAPMSQI